jgi:hypothetical protein
MRLVPVTPIVRIRCLPAQHAPVNKMGGSFHSEDHEAWVGMQLVTWEAILQMPPPEMFNDWLRP